MADRGAAYQARIDQLAASGVDLHGEADLVESLGARRILDAGCGTGRVAIELARRGRSVTGVDADPEMLAIARQRAPELDWRLGDLASMDMPPGAFDLAVLAGNVMLFVARGTEAAVLANVARALEPGGLLVAGFARAGDWTIDEYETWAHAAGLEALDRWATWDRRAWSLDAGYTVAVHRLGRNPEGAIP